VYNTAVEWTPQFAMERGLYWRTTSGAAQFRPTMVATAGDKMQVLGAVIPMQSFGHSIRIDPKVQA
jgi:hypothetical protein